jgi:hypothetical protein
VPADLGFATTQNLAVRHLFTTIIFPTKSWQSAILAGNLLKSC